MSIQDLYCNIIWPVIVLLTPGNPGYWLLLQMHLNKETSDHAVTLITTQPQIKSGQDSPWPVPQASECCPALLKYVFPSHICLLIFGLFLNLFIYFFHSLC